MRKPSSTGADVMRAIFSCDCGNVPARAVAAAKVRFGSPTPPIYPGKDAIRSVLPSLPASLQPYAKGLLTTRGRFAYYLEWGDNKVVKYDLLKGKFV